MQTTSKQVKRPMLSETGEYVLTQHGRQLRFKGNLAYTIIRNSLNYLHHFVTWGDSVWKQGPGEKLLSHLGQSPHQRLLITEAICNDKEHEE